MKRFIIRFLKIRGIRHEIAERMRLAEMLREGL